MIPGLDAEAGLRYLGGRVPSYVRLLRRFAEEHSNDAASISAFVAAGDYKAAREVAHSLKGVAGTLGAVRLQALVAGLEQLLVTDGSQQDVNGLCEAAQKELESLAGSILAHLST